MTTGFNITIKDNFFEEQLFNTLRNKVGYLKFGSQYNTLGYDKKHPWFTCLVEEDVREIIKNKSEKIWNKKFKINFCVYTLVATVEPLPHCDLTDNCDHQILIYIKGNTNLHKGTGFYLNGELNTHIGFNENRDVSWHSNTVHSPLNWAANDKSKRYSIVCQLKEI